MVDGRCLAVRIVAEQAASASVIVDVVTGDTLLVAEGSEAIWLDGHTLLVER